MQGYIIYQVLCFFNSKESQSINLTHSLEGAENKEAQEKKINKMKKAKHNCYFGRDFANKTCQWFLMRRNLV